MTAATRTTAKPGLWVGLYLANMAIISALFVTQAIEPPVPYILYALCHVLLIPMIKAGRQLQEEKGAITRAIRNYNRRFLICSTVYAVGMLGASGMTTYVSADSPAMWGLAILPMLPAFGMIWAMMRYLAEETDEYQRFKAVRASMVGLGFVLVIGTGWGFLETFGLVPHVWAWWVFPAWAMGLGIGAVLPERGGEAW